MNWFGNNNEKRRPSDAIKSIEFDLTIKEDDFARYMISNLFSKIFLMIFDKMKFENKSDSSKKNNKKQENNIVSENSNLKEIYAPAFYDNMSSVEVNKGIIQELSKAIAKKTKVFLVCEQQVKDEIFIVREGTADEEQKYDEAKGIVKNQIKMDFSQYVLTDLLLLYFNMIYWIIRSTNTNVRLSNSILVKISKLRELVANDDAEGVIKQAEEINNALKSGNSVITDKEDSLERMQIDADSTVKALEIAFSLIAGLLGLPISFFNGILTTGLTQTGDSDNLAIERGLIPFYYSIMKPCTEKLFNIKTKFIKDNTSRIKTLTEILPALELTDLLTQEQKQEIVGDLIG